MRLSLAFLLVFGIAAVACATTSRANFDDDDGSTGSVTGSGGTGGTSVGNTNASVGGSSTNAASSTAVNSVANSTVSSVNNASSSSGMNCLQDPNCPECFCNQDPNGCNDYINFLVTHIYCGQSCGAGDCSAFCTSMDPNQITPACDTCIQNVAQPDIDAFLNACQASVGCFNFLQQASMCP